MNSKVEFASYTPLGLSLSGGRTLEGFREISVIIFGKNSFYAVIKRMEGFHIILR